MVSSKVIMTLLCCIKYSDIVIQETFYHGIQPTETHLRGISEWLAITYWTDSSNGSNNIQWPTVSETLSVRNAILVHATWEGLWEDSSCRRLFCWLRSQVGILTHKHTKHMLIYLARLAFCLACVPRWTFEGHVWIFSWSCSYCSHCNPIIIVTSLKPPVPRDTNQHKTNMDDGSCRHAPLHGGVDAAPSSVWYGNRVFKQDVLDFIGVC